MSTLSSPPIASKESSNATPSFSETSNERIEESSQRSSLDDVEFGKTTNSSKLLAALLRRGKRHDDEDVGNSESVDSTAPVGNNRDLRDAWNSFDGKFLKRSATDASEDVSVIMTSKKQRSSALSENDEYRGNDSSNDDRSRDNDRGGGGGEGTVVVDSSSSSDTDHSDYSEKSESSEIDDDGDDDDDDG